MDSHAELPAAEAILQHSQFVRSLARHLLGGDEHEADDLAQEALLRYVQSPPRNPLDPRAWFARVLRNLANNQRRGQSNRALREQRAARNEITPPEDESADTAILSSVVDAVLALDEPYRSTIVARYYRDHEPSRIAAETGTPLATVKSRLSRAHQQLREHLDRTHGSRDAWGLALGSLVDVSAKATVASTAAITPALGFALMALLVGAISLAIWRGTRSSEIVRESSGELAQASSVTPSETHGQDRLAAPAASAREVAKAAVPEGSFAIEGSLLNAAYPPLSMPGGAAGGVKLDVRLVTERRGTGDTLAQAHVETDGTGRFSAKLPLPSTSAFLVSIAAPADERWRAVSFEEAVAKGAQARSDLELVRVAHGIVEGKVLDPAGVPLPGLAVRLVSWQEGKQVDLISDDQGVLRGELPGVRTVAVQDPAWSLVGFEPGKLLPAGGETGLKVIVSQAARIALRAIDARGAGLAHVAVQIQLDPSEQRPDTDPFTGAQTRSADTDAEGRAEIGGVWAGHKLRIHLTWRGTPKLTSSGLRGSELLFDAAELAGAPIVLGPGEVRELVARWGGLVRIEGDVVHPDLSPATDVPVNVYDLGRPNGDHQSLAEARSDANGAIAIELRSRELLGPLVVLAGDTAQIPAGKAAGLGYADEVPRLALSRAMLELDPRAAVEDVLSVHLVLEPLLSIRGQVLEADGSPITKPQRAVRLECARAGESALRAGRGPLLPVLTWGPGSRFELRGLLPGDHDLYAARIEWPTFYSWEGNASCARRVQAGSTEVELRLVPREETRIKVRIVGAAAGSALAMRAKLNAEAAESKLPDAPRKIIVESLTGWPLQAPLRFGGISGGEDEHGRWSYGFDSFDNTEKVFEFELPAMDPGIYRIGVQISDADGKLRWFPQASAPMRFEAGVYEVEFHAVAAGTLEGRVQGDVGEQRIGVQLLDASGAIVPLPRLAGSARPELAREIDAGGRFRLDPAPFGQFQLRLGRLDELALGRGRMAVPVEIGAEPQEALELRWR
ncbi:MAG TPA: sigma-70 family RNA polymerase sigma factor [Planctomycetota bacterium]|nr:sigma-70 family RNA polymerase sigma factor [Planctomycetota bacterium]